ncbi:RHS repeat domain-containing protein [Cohnella sp. GCM10012308]|uniref:RHS repeat domain-containing protein n=1 Tax=Cohnella sp. GCM10012308 TaxID=3317329 RepID=UPI00361239D1
MIKKSLLYLGGFIAILWLSMQQAPSAHADVIGDTAVMNGLITQQQINQTKKPQYADASSSSELVDPVSGSLTWKQNHIHLPGRDGLDLDVGIMYQSNYGYAYEQMYAYPYTRKKNYLISRYDLGVGWSFRFPSVQIEEGGYKYYHDGEGGVYQVDYQLTGDAELYTHLKGYQGKDVQFLSGGSFSNGAETSAYYLEYASKKREYFAADGKLLGIVDRYGNTIKFQYTTRTLYDGQPHALIASIEDTIGRKVIFSYENTLQTTGTFNGEKITLTVKDASNADVQEISYLKGRSDDTRGSMPDGHSPMLTQFKNQEGQITSFENQFMNGLLFNYNSKSLSGAINNYFILLSKIIFPNSQTTYNYDVATHNLGEWGVRQEARISSRFDQLRKYSNGGSTSSFVGNYNYLSYLYTGDYTGYPTYSNPDTVPATYLFSSTATAGEASSVNPTKGLKTTTTFNGLKQQISLDTRATNGEHQITRYTAFDSLYSFKPTSMQSELHASDSDASPDVLKTFKTYTAWGELQSETRPLTDSQINGGLQSKYTTAYSYEPSYRQLSGKTWYQNESDSTQKNESYQYDTSGRLKQYVNAAGEVTNTCYEVIPGAGGASVNTCQGTNPPTTGKVAKVVSTKGSSKTEMIFSAATNYAFPAETDQYFTDGSTAKVVKAFMSYYPGTGLLKEKWDESNNKTVYTYDKLGRTTEIKYPRFKNQGVPQVEYDVSDYFSYANNYFSSDFDSANEGLSSLYFTSYRKYIRVSDNVQTELNRRYEYYDGLGNLRLGQSWDYDTNQLLNTQYHYDDMGRAVDQADPMSNTLNVTFDIWGRQIEAKDAFSNLYKTTYNLKGRQSTNYFVGATTLTVQSNHIITQLDQWGRMISRTAYKGTSQTSPMTEYFGYDILGNVISYKDPKGNLNENNVTTGYTYDVLGRLTQVKDSLNQLTNYSYDSTTGQLKQITIQASPTDTPKIIRGKQFNELGQLAQKTDMSGVSESFNYNSLGQLTTYTDRSGAVYGYQYDAQNRQTFSSVTLGSVSQATKMTIGSNNILTDKTEIFNNGVLSSSMNVTINQNKQVTGVTQSATGYSSSLSLNYDKLGRVTRQTNNSAAQSVNFTYDKTRLLRVQTDGQSTLSTAAGANAIYAYFDNGRVKTITYPTLTGGAQLLTTYAYTPLNQVKTVTNTRAGTIISKYDYAYDNNGNIESVTETVAGQGASIYTYVYDKLNRLSAVKLGGTTTASYSYDLLGSRTEQRETATNSNLNEASFIYDLLNTLKSATIGFDTTSFEYGANGLRYKKTATTGTVQYQYDLSGQVISESDASNAITAKYVRGDRLLMKQAVNAGVAGSKYYYLYNGHGDVVQIVDENGTVVNKYSYDVWGTPTAQVEGVPNAFKYSGETYDSETGLYYLRARYYDPSVGRFINEDTYEGQINNPLSLNIYTYVENNPLIYTDPSGHDVHDATFNKNQYTYLKNLASGNGPAAAWAKQQIKESRYYIDPAEPKKIYTLDEKDKGGVREDYLSEVLAVPLIAAGIVYAPAVAAAADVATMGVSTSGIATGTIIAGKSAGFLSSLFGPSTTKLYRSVSEEELVSIQTLGKFSEGPNSSSSKWMVPTLAQAEGHAENLANNTRIIEVTVPTSSISQAYPSSNLDLLGQAYAYDIDFLNSIFTKVKVVK